MLNHHHTAHHAPPSRPRKTNTLPLPPLPRPAQLPARLLPCRRSHYVVLSARAIGEQLFSPMDLYSGASPYRTLLLQPVIR